MSLLRYVKMSCAGPLLVLVLLVISTLASPTPAPSTTSRSPPRIVDSLKQLTNQLVEVNSSSPNVMTFDTRTPPRVRQQTKTKLLAQMENSHAGVAIPIDGDEIEDAAEATTKKLSFYKIERPTTNSGLSTWILLSGQTTKAPKKQPPVMVKPNEGQNASLIVNMSNKIVKPIFKKRPISTTERTTTTQISSTSMHKNATKMTKIKASVLSNAVNKKTTPSMTTTKKATTPKTITTTASPPMKNITVIKEDKAENATNDSNNLPVEAKDGETDLTETPDDKKNKRTSSNANNKRKKNKNRRRRPADKADNSNNTKIEKTTKTKEKPIGTQLYNYISREVMPTVGVGLVGLMVTAGLAGYFLYPFGIARRSYEVDRRDKEGSYYYSDENSGGIAEEEAIGKVIAGMPSNSLFGNTYKTPTSRNGFSTGSNKNKMRNRQVDTNNVQSNANYDYQPVTYNYNNNDEDNGEKDLVYNTGEEEPQQFVVGSVSKEEVTPAAVPEHGPRSLKIRRRRRDAPLDNSDEINNEVNADFEVTTKETLSTTSTTGRPSTTTEKDLQENKWNSFMHMMKELVHLKVNLGLELIRNATRAMSTYVSHVQRRFDEHYKNYTDNSHFN